MSKFPALQPHRILTAADVRGLQPHFVETAVGQSFSSSGTPAVVEELVMGFTAEFGASYIVEARWLFNVSPSQVDLQIVWSGVTGMNLTIQSMGASSTNASVISRTNTRLTFASGNSQYSFVGDGLDNAVWQTAALGFPTEGGDVQVSFTPVDPLAGTFIRDLGSVLKVHRFA